MSVSTHLAAFSPTEHLAFHPVLLSLLRYYFLIRQRNSVCLLLEIHICLSSHLQAACSGLAGHSSIRQHFRWHSPGHTVTERRIRKKKDNRFLLAVNTAFQSSSASAFIFLSSDFPLLLRHLLVSSHYHRQPLFDYSLLSSIFSLSRAQRGKLEYVLALLFFLIPC